MMKTVTLLFLSLLLTTQLARSEDNDAIVDRIAITHQIAEYAYRWDSKDAAGLSELFAEDGSISWILGGNAEDTVVAGREDIAAYARQAHAERLAGKQSRHHFTNIVFEELDADHASTKHMVHVTHQVPGMAPESVVTGIYRMSWKKVLGRWMITRRTLHVDR